MEKCADCGQFFETMCDHNSDGMLICNICAENYVECDYCGDIYEESDCIVLSSGEVVCGSCADEHCTTCDDCGATFYYDEMRSDDNGTNVCDDCYQRAWTRCDDCGVLIHEDDWCCCDNGTFCESCYPDNCDDEERYSDWRHEYGYTPSLKFHHAEGESTDLYFGTEVEIDCGDLDEFDFKSLPNDKFWCTTDGSLDENGIEVISHPMTYQYIMSNMPHKTLIDVAKKAGYRSHNTNTCGYHIHMSRRAFETDQRVEHFVYLFERFFDESLLRFSRRTMDSLNSYARRYLDKEGTDVKVADVKGRIGSDHSRYRMVNLSNHATIEVRIFRGTLNHNTIIASIQLCKLFFDLSIFNERAIEKMTWSEVKDFAADKYPEFIEYCKERGI